MFFLIFGQPKLVSQAQLTSSSTHRGKLRKNGKTDKALYDDQLLALFSWQISMYMLNEKIFVLLISQPV